MRLYDVLNANQDWLPRDLGTLTPIVKPKGIDDVPVVAVTLWSPQGSPAVDLEAVAHTLETEFKAVVGVREVQSIGDQAGRCGWSWIRRACGRGMSMLWG